MVICNNNLIQGVFQKRAGFLLARIISLKLNHRFEKPILGSKQKGMAQ